MRPWRPSLQVWTGLSHSLRSQRHCSGRWELARWCVFFPHSAQDCTSHCKKRHVSRPFRGKTIMVLWQTIYRVKVVTQLLVDKSLSYLGHGREQRDWSIYSLGDHALPPDFLYIGMSRASFLHCRTYALSKHIHLDKELLLMKVSDAGVADSDIFNSLAMTWPLPPALLAMPRKAFFHCL